MRLVIVGGGTAGWLAALLLKEGRDVTVIESSRLGTIGVGEGTTALFRQTLKHLGLDERDFLRQTGATIKYGIRHQDWRRVGHSYDGPIDDPRAVTDPALDHYAVAAGKPVAEAHLFSHLMSKGRAPVARAGGREVPAGPFHHAYHFDQAKAGAWLRRQAAGVCVVDDIVCGLDRDGETGDIRAVLLEGGDRVEGDVFLDCTGFRRALIGPLGARWIDYAASLPANRAMPFWLDLKEGEEIAPLTLARALGAGWMWRIPTQDRYGCGYVYSDAHTGPDAAKAEVEAALGHAIEPRNDIRIDAGRLDTPWRHNCIAIGLSSSFLEPLEATSIHGTLVQLLWLRDWLGAANVDPAARDRYNSAAARQVDEYRDFIRLHYVTERRDTPFWRDVAASHPAAVTDRLAAWGGRLPEARDFTPLPLGLPHVEEVLHRPVLDGLGLLSRDVAKRQMATDPARRARLRQSHDRITREYRRAAAECLPHRAWLASLTPTPAQRETTT
ncbi:tryptophan halogenase family protein [Wenxinia saemankumensis]|uniref:Tryptophan halogenase n=1 Tax=Wenxinia saemankumensis TaxID=1447782 RepID=A0A1M6FGC3_9RHOB|nr:tryptophan halogenase family protein [Wenxinia saemankumensis]SHI96801.1 tryptophan halogenase [Wenxinia saemankumensis]